jgi:hypothetical protein
MHLFRTSPLVLRLASRSVSAEERAKYLLASFLLFNVAYYSGFVLSTALPWTVPSALEAAMVMGLNILGVVKSFDASGGSRNADFLTEFTCLYVPVSVTTLLAVWGSYWVLTVGFREALMATFPTHSQFALNLSYVGVDLFGFLTLAANVGVVAITFARLTKLLSEVRYAKRDA